MKKLISPLLILLIIILIITMTDAKSRYVFAVINLEEKIHKQNEEINKLELTNNLYQIVVIEQDEVIKLQDKIIDEYISSKIYLGEYTITAYCPCATCCGKWARSRQKDEYGNDLVYGASGEVLISGISVASNLPFNTTLIIDNKEYVVNDRISNWVAEKYQGKIIDIYFDSHQQAIEFAKQIKDVYIKNNEV